MTNDAPIHIHNTLKTSNTLRNERRREHEERKGWRDRKREKEMGKQRWRTWTTFSILRRTFHACRTCWVVLDMMFCAVEEVADGIPRKEGRRESTVIDRMLALALSIPNFSTEIPRNRERDGTGSRRKDRQTDTNKTRISFHQRFVNAIHLFTLCENQWRESCYCEPRR